MKIAHCLILLLFATSCTDDRPFDPFDYEGEYPTKLDGSPIKTVMPQYDGGEINIIFNEHQWNHYPLITVNGYENQLIGIEGTNEYLELSISSMLDRNYVDPCILETLFLRTTAKVGVTSFNDANNEYIIASFRTSNCDAGKDNYILNKQKQNLLEILSYEKTSGEVTAKFDLHFTIEKRNSNFEPIYPKNIDIKGTLKTIALVM